MNWCLDSKLECLRQDDDGGWLSSKKKNIAGDIAKYDKWIQMDTHGQFISDYNLSYYKLVHKMKTIMFISFPNCLPMYRVR